MHVNCKISPCGWCRWPCNWKTTLHPWPCIRVWYPMTKTTWVVPCSWSWLLKYFKENNNLNPSIVSYLSSFLKKTHVLSNISLYKSTGAQMRATSFVIEQQRGEKFTALWERCKAPHWKCKASPDRTHPRFRQSPVKCIRCSWKS